MIVNIDISGRYWGISCSPTALLIFYPTLFSDMYKVVKCINYDEQWKMIFRETFFVWGKVREFCLGKYV
jgi:hypothetical protein